MENKNLIISILVISVIIVIFSLIGVIQNNQDTITPSQSNITLKITILGSTQEKEYRLENITALELLQKDNIVNFTNYDFGIFINCINGICSNDDQFWMYYINGQEAPIGVSNYFIKGNDTIDFRYESIN